MEQLNIQAFTCKDCNRTYKDNGSLRKHVKKRHPLKLSELAPSLRDMKTYRHFCNECNRRFNSIWNLRSHKYAAHNAVDPTYVPRNTKRYNVNCSMCKIVLPKKKIISHYEVEHDVKIETEELEFSSYDTFIEWKKEMEKREKTSFIKRTLNANKKLTKFNFICHRSGLYTPRGTGIRRLKVQGSKKIGYFCPATLKGTIDKTGKCNIYFLKTHCGHENKIKYLFLTSEEKNAIASKIADEIPFSNILSEICNSDKDSERLQLLKRKDLFNIANSSLLSKLKEIKQKGEVESNLINSHNVPKNNQVLYENLAEEQVGAVNSITVEENTVTSADMGNENVKDDSEYFINELQPEISDNELVLTNNIHLRKKNLKRIFCQYIDNISTVNEIEIWENNLKSIQSALNSASSGVNKLFLNNFAPNFNSGNKIIDSRLQKKGNIEENCFSETYSTLKGSIQLINLQPS